MKIIDICTERDVACVTGVVRNVWNIRNNKELTTTENSSSVVEENDLTVFTDNGPLTKKSQKVFSLSMYSFRGDASQRRESSAEVMLYFYDVWAEKCAFFSPGDILTISGPARMVYAARLEEKDDFPYCLVFKEEKRGGDGLQVMVESQNINTKSRQVTFTSQSLHTAPAPPLIDWAAVSKKNKEQKNAKPPRPQPVSVASSTLSNVAVGKQSSARNPPPVVASSATTSTPLPSLAYTYTPISDIRGTALIGKLINIYGVIHTYQQPKSTKGSHKYSCSYTLLDPSSVQTTGASDASPGSVQTVVLVYFANNLASFPPVKRVGDIVRLHRVKVAFFQEKPQLLGWEVRSSFLHFHCRSAASLTAGEKVGEGSDLNQLVQHVRTTWELTSSSEKYSFNEATAAAINALQKFILSVFPTPSLSFAHINKDINDTTDYRVRLRALRTGQHGQSHVTNDPSSHPQGFANIDAVVLVVNIRGDEVEGEDQLPGVLHLLVWDGSDIGGGSITTPDAGGKEDMVVDAATVRIAAQAVASVQAILPSSSPSCPLHMLAGGYAVLTMLRAEAPQQLRAATTLTPGTWIRVQHFSRRAHPSAASLHNFVGEKSAINVLPPFCCDVKDIVNQYIHSTLPQLPAAPVPATVLGKRRMTSSSGRSFTPLALCLAAPSPSSFLVLVGVRSCHPASFANIVMVHRSVAQSATDSSCDRGNVTSPISDVEMVAETQVDTEMDTEEPGVENTLVEDEIVATTSPVPVADDATPSYRYTYMFSVCIFDDTACCDAIVYAEDGEQLLGGVTAEQLYHNPGLQQSCQDKLASAIADGATFEFNIVTYLTAHGPLGEKGSAEAALGPRVTRTPPCSDSGGTSSRKSSARKTGRTKNDTTIVDCNAHEERDSDRKLIKRVRIVNSSFFQLDE